MVLGEEQHITRSPAACAKIGQNFSAVSGIRRGPSGDLRRELVWMLGKPPRLTALLAQLLSTRRRDGVRVNPLGRMAGLGCVEISTRLTRAKSQHRCMAGKFSAITLGRRGGGTHLLPSLPLRTLEVEGRSHGGVRRVPAGSNVLYLPTVRRTEPCKGLVEMLHRQLAPEAQAPRDGVQGPMGVFATGGAAPHRTATTASALVEDRPGRCSEEAGEGPVKMDMYQVNGARCPDPKSRPFQGTNCRRQEDLRGWSCRASYVPSLLRIVFAVPANSPD
jgi:hypothetical protein